MLIREATGSDAEEIRQLVFSILDEYGLQADPGTTDRDLDNLERSYGGNGGYFAVVEEQGSIVATVGIMRIDEHTCELRKMYALPSSRGKGLGRQLLEHAISRARELGYRKMTLETASVLKEAISLYRKYGFREYYPEHLSARCDQAFVISLAGETEQGE